MYGQTLALAALSAAGAMAAPQMCACQPSDNALVSAAGISATPSAYGPASTIISTVTAHDTQTITQVVDSTSSAIPVQTITSTITEHDTKTQTITQVVDTSSSPIPVQTITETETETTTSTITSTSTVGATHTPVAPVVSSGSIRQPGAPYYPTYGSGGPSGVAGSSGVAQSTGTAVSAPSISVSSTPGRYSYSIPIGTGRPSGTPLNSVVSSASPSAPGYHLHTPASYHTPQTPVGSPYVPSGTPTPSGTPLADSTSAPYPNPYSIRTSSTPTPSGTPTPSSAPLVDSTSAPSPNPYSAQSTSPIVGPSRPVTSETATSSLPVTSSTPTTSLPVTSNTPSATPEASNVSSTSASATGSSPQSTSVSNPTCFANGAATNGASDSAGAPAEASYQCYSGPASNFPTSDKWTSYEDMKKVHAKLGQTACASGPLNTQEQTDMIFAAIDVVAPAAKVDKRVVLAQIVQESSGCVNVGATANGVNNPGLMQTHNGASFVGNAAGHAEQAASVIQMVSDGVQGTYYKAGGGDGIVQLLNAHGDFFTAARAYNSGFINKDNLSDAMGATASYCSDTANYLQGWDGAARGSCSF